MSHRLARLVVSRCVARDKAPEDAPSVLVEESVGDKARSGDGGERRPRSREGLAASRVGHGTRRRHRSTRVMERAASARLSSGTYSASWFVARALWVVLHVFLWTRSAPRAAVDRAFRVSGLAFLEPRRACVLCAQAAPRAGGGVVQNAVGRSRRVARPPPRAGGHRERPRDEASASRCLADAACACSFGPPTRASGTSRCTTRTGAYVRAPAARRAGGSRDGARGVGAAASIDDAAAVGRPGRFFRTTTARDRRP